MPVSIAFIIPIKFTEMIRILYFGALRERLGTEAEELAWTAGCTSDTLRSRDEHWAEVLAPGQVFRVAVNRQIVHGDTPVPDGAEVGILPPVTGG